MKIDGSSMVEPSPTDDPYAMGPVAVVIDIDLDALAQKVWLITARLCVLSVQFGGDFYAV